MPIHDWSKVDANLFHHFHQAWTLVICNSLNGGVLPAGFSALVEQRTGGVVPDVLAIENASNGQDKTRSLGGSVAVAPRPKTTHHVQSTKLLLADKANRIAIHHRLGNVVCIIEIVSPGNKASRSALAKFVEKSVFLLAEGVHLLVVDLFPPTSRDPHGIHRAIWDVIDEDHSTFELPHDKPLTLAAYVAGEPMADLTTEAYVEPVRVGAPLPDMPAYLNRDLFVDVPLEATYQETWKSCPAAMRAVIEQGK